MISPTDTAYPVLPASPLASELTDAYTPNVFELKFAEENTRQPTPRVSLLVLLKTFQRLGYFVKLADASRMKEAQPDKRYAFAVVLIQRQRARALDDAADMLIRLVQRMHNTAKEKLLLLQSARLQQSGDLVAKLRDVGLAYLSDRSETERLQSIGLLLGPDVQELLQRCEEHVALSASNHFRLLPKCFGHPRQALLALLENLPLSSTSQNRSMIDAIAFVLANQNVRAPNVSVSGNDQREPLDLGFVSDGWWSLVTGLKTRSTASQIDRRLFELCVVTQVANDLKSGDLYIREGDKFRDYRLQLLSWEEVERELANYGEQAGIATEPKLFIAQLRQQLEERGKAADKSLEWTPFLRQPVNP